MLTVHYQAQRHQVTQTSVVFIDAGVTDYQELVTGVRSGFEVLVLSPAEDGLAQITAALKSRPAVTSVHIVSHGSPGVLHLGNRQVSLQALESNREALQAWFPASSHQKVDLLLYGCNVAAGDTGAEFIEKLHYLTGANVAASQTVTGDSAQGGNWDLEVILGTVESDLAFEREALEAYSAVLVSPSEFDTADETSYPNFDSWQTGGNGGNGFGAWTISTTNGNSGYFVGGSTYNGDDASDYSVIDEDGDVGRGWALWANSGGISRGSRSFTKPLGAGDRFQIQMDTGFVLADGSIGFSLHNSQGQEILKIALAGSSTNYLVTDGSGVRDSGLGFTDEGLTVTVELTSATTYQVTITSIFDGSTRTVSGSLMNPSGGQTVSEVAIFNQSAGPGPASDAFFSNMAIFRAPEPSNNAPTITSGDTANVAEGNTTVLTVTATDLDNDTVSFSITGGADKALFSIDATTGALTFINTPDFEVPTDSDGNNVYLVEVTANDGKGGTDIQGITVTVTDVPEGGSGVMIGTPQDDRLTGDDAINTIYGLEGNDRLFGKGGNDTLIGGEGNDLLDGGSGNDRMIGGAGNDKYYIDSAGDEVIEAENEGNDIVYSQIDWTLADHVERLVLQGNAIAGTGNALNNTLTGNALNNILSGGDGNDALTGGAGDDVLDGGNGIDRVSETKDANFTLTNTQLVGNGTDTLISIEGATLVGGNSANLIDASAFTLGSVNLNGKGGNDTLLGGSANDVLIGGAGDDVLNGGGGIDRVNETADVNFTLTNTQLVGNGTDTLISIERATLIGGNSANLIDASAFTLGSVNLNGRGGNDTLLGGSTNDVLIGGLGSDSLNGGAGNDRLTGVDAAVVNPGLGEVDILIGGLGADTFVLGDRKQVYYNDGNDSTSGINDYALIVDFSVAQKDVILLRGTAADYRLEQGTGGTRLYWTAGAGEDEMIALLQDVSADSLDLTSKSGFRYVAPVVA